MGNVWFAADTHFDHENIRVHCNRPWKSCHEMNEAIVSNFNSVIGKKDTIYIVGDFAWKNHGRWICALNGHKVFIPGNHDKMNLEHLRCFSNNSKNPKEDKIFETKIDNHRVVMCHFPMVSWNASCHGSWHIYGHVHGRYVHPGLAMDVGIDTNNYMPYSWDDVKRFMYAKIDSEREKSGLYVGWKQIRQDACVGIVSMTKDNAVLVMHQGRDNISSTHEVRRLSDEKGGYFEFMGQRYYDSGVMWKK